RTSPATIGRGTRRGPVPQGPAGGGLGRLRAVRGPLAAVDPQRSPAPTPAPRGGPPAPRRPPGTVARRAPSAASGADAAPGHDRSSPLAEPARRPTRPAVEAPGQPRLAATPQPPPRRRVGGCPAPLRSASLRS